MSAPHYIELQRASHFSFLRGASSCDELFAQAAKPEAKIDAFVEHYNHRRYHESLGNLTPADVYFGHAQTIRLERERIKRAAIRNRRLIHQKQAA